ncbi:MAG: glutamyl-tRNA reductase [candidate division Zixibacteria bacterium]|nr:glutamyl-tRNA reductase [candidate division Zixibacteria bacterium]
MLSFGVIGLSVKSGNFPLLEALVLPEADRIGHLQALQNACGFRELVALQTCNRVEFYYSSGQRTAGTEYRNRLLDYLLRGRDKVQFEPGDLYSLIAFRALRHLYRVAASLDSLVVGEAQILGQVKQALAEAQAAGTVGPGLGLIFAEAFRVAKKVRRETPLGRYAVSMVNLLLDSIAEHLRGRDNPTVAIVGVGPMSVKLAAHLKTEKNARLLFVNRTESKAAELAGRFDGASISLDSFLTDPPSIDVVFTATGASQPIFTSAAVESLRAATTNDVLVIDLAMPRDVDPAAAGVGGVRCLDILHFRDVADSHRRERFRAVDAAEAIIDQAIGRAHKLNAHREFQPVLASSLNEGLAYAQAGLQKLFENRLAHLNDVDRESIAHWVRQLVQYTNHLPLTALAEQADIAREDCALLAGYDCVEDRASAALSTGGDAEGDATHPAANRCAVREGRICLGRSTDDLSAL